MANFQGHFFGDLVIHSYLEAAVFSSSSGLSFPPTQSSRVNTVVCCELQFQLKVGGTDLSPGLIKQQNGALLHTISLSGVRGS